MTQAQLGLCLILALLIIGATALFAYIVWKRDRDEYDPSMVTNLKYNPETEIMTFNGGRTGNPYKVRGRCTVWRTMSGRRFDTLMESKLSDIWDYCQYND
jgi:hypothetical protein